MDALATVVTLYSALDPCPHFSSGWSRTTISVNKRHARRLYGSTPLIPAWPIFALKLTLAMKPSPESSSEEAPASKQNDDSQDKLSSGSPTATAAAAASPSKPPAKKRAPPKKAPAKKTTRKRAASGQPKNDADHDDTTTEEQSPPKSALRRTSSTGRKKRVSMMDPTSTTTTTTTTTATTKARLRQELNALHQEMEVAHYLRKDKRGHLRRMVPREKAKHATQARKSLERQDWEQQALFETSRRLSGSAAAQMEQAVQKSLAFGDDDEDDDEKEEEEEEEEEEDTTEVDPLSSEHGDTAGDFSDHNEEDSDQDDDEEEEEEEEEEEASTTPKAKGKQKAQPGKRQSRRGRTKSKRMVRLRAFKSHRLAQREGEAIALHIQGRHNEAIAKLKEIAVDKPAAPQVYSALGMVYEAMLKESIEGWGQESDPGEPEGSAKDDSMHNESEDGQPDPHVYIPVAIRKQIELATKAYGAFHVAAILYKKDYQLWVRGADISVQIAELYDEVLATPDMPGTTIDLSKTEKKRWLLEAKNDYQAAENLNPPGIDVGAKLASILVQLGNLSEAFTLLTDMKSRKNPDTGLRDFDSSHRAWVLYADLLLQIGFECEQWNKGDFSNNHLVFRRWLRKHASTFNWQERRIQALVKALEAAAGTKCCGGILSWLKAEISNADGKAPGEGASLNQNSNASRVATRAGGQSRVGKPSSEGVEEDQDLLDRSEADELANFDRTTAEMKLPAGSKAAQLRQNERTIVADRLKRRSSSTLEEGIATQSENTSDEIEYQQPLSASVATVVEIASELMHLMLILGVYEGCSLVGEAVSLYLRERLSLFQQRRSLAPPEADDDSVVPEKGAPYDILNVASDEEESVILLSDDEELRRTEDESVLASMEKGVLPPVLLVFYGISLLGAGKKRYLAVKCIDSIRQLPGEKLEWFQYDPSERDRGLHFRMFEERYRHMPKKTNMLAVIARMILSSTIDDDKTTQALEEILGFIDRRLSLMKVIPQYHLSHDQPSPLHLQRLSNVLYVSAAFTHCLYRRASKTAELDKDLTQSLMESVRRTTKISYSLWKMELDGCLSEHVMAALHTAAKALHLLCDRSSPEVVKDLMDDVELWMCRFCTLPTEKIRKFRDNAADALMAAHLPLDVDWLTPARSRLSIRCHNLAVSSAVDSFSGWSEKEFSANTLNTTDRPAYIGLLVSEGRIAGHLHESMRLELVKQWATIQKLRPHFVVSGRIAHLLRNVEETEWYETNREKFHDLESAGFMSQQGEIDGLWMCTCFSRISITLSESTKDSVVSRGHILNAMSVLLPLSQYILNERLWGAGLGIVPHGTKLAANSRTAAAAAAAAAVVATSTSTRAPKRITAPPKDDSGSRKRKRRSIKPKDPHFRLDSENDSFPIANLIKLSSAEFKVMWSTDVVGLTAEQEDSRSALMAALHEKMRLLRSCFSLLSVQRASLEIAASLLDVAAHPSCDNAFLVINHAANYASKGVRGGSSDRFFKKKLPGENSTPLDLLVVLGRADCLNAVGFVAEASFLISYVANECSVHRSREGAWNDKWKFVSIYAYNLSVLTRANKDGVFGDIFIWKENAIQELGRARSDGLRAFGEVQVDIPDDNEDEEEDYETDDEDEARLVAATKIPKPSKRKTSPEEGVVPDNENDENFSESGAHNDDEQSNSKGITVGKGPLVVDQPATFEPSAVDTALTNLPKAPSAEDTSIPVACALSDEDVSMIVEL